MKITPLEIRQKSFEKGFRGYDKDEVHAFLLTLSQEWERVLDDSKEFRIKLEASERQVAKLREVESSLYKTLKTAEDTGTHLVEQAKQAADLHLRESQIKAEAMLNEAKTKAKDMIEEAEARAKSVLADTEDQLKIALENYKRLESSRDDLIADMKRLATDALERIERTRAQTKTVDIDTHIKNIRNNNTNKKHEETVELTVLTELNVTKESTTDTAHPNHTVKKVKPASSSFFDEIG